MRSVLITGASSGIGQKLCQDYLVDGWQVIACGRHGEKLSAALGTESSQLSFCLFDQCNKTITNEQLNQIRIEDIDLVILNAGHCEYIDDAKNLDAEVFKRVINNNVMGSINCLEALLPRLPAGSRVALISSAATYLPFSRAAAYGASKAALDYIARVLAIDLAPSGIAVSLIRPGFVDTPLTQKNDFPMPGRISVADASRYIRKGLAKGKAEISFPRGFILLLQLLSLLPQGLWRQLSQKMIRHKATKDTKTT